MQRPILLAVAAALVGSSACRRGDALSTSDSSFVATMVELRRIPAGPDTTGPAREAILRRRRVTADSLERYARTLATDPERAAAVWREIEKVPPNAPPTPAANPAATPTPLTPEAIRKIRKRVD